MFVFDLDGTLLNSKSEISEENLKALEKAKEKGHKLIIATGRNYIYTQLVVKNHWGLFDYYIGCNGAILNSIHERKFDIGEQKIDFDFVLKIIEKIKAIGGTIQVSTIWGVFTDFFIPDGVNIISEQTKKTLFDPFPMVSEMSDEEKKSIIQISVHLEEHVVRKCWEEWEELYGNDYELTITSKRNIDINLKNISKLSRTKEIAKMENIDYENVFVFGDSQNDLKGLEYYNNTYAMENALEDVKKVAKNVIGNNDSKDIGKVVLKNI